MHQFRETQRESHCKTRGKIVRIHQARDLDIHSSAMEETEEQSTNPGNADTSVKCEFDEFDLHIRIVSDTEADDDEKSNHQLH